MRWPIAFGGKLAENFARTTPELPWELDEKVRIGQIQLEFGLIKNLPGDLAPDGSGAVGLAIWSA